MVSRDAVSNRDPSALRATHNLREIEVGNMHTLHTSRAHL